MSLITLPPPYLLPCKVINSQVLGIQMWRAALFYPVHHASQLAEICPWLPVTNKTPIPVQGLQGSARFCNHFSNQPFPGPLLLSPWPVPAPLKTLGHFVLRVLVVVALSGSVSVQPLNRVRFFATPWIAARQASLSITNSWSLFKHMSIKSVMPSNRLILCCSFLLLPSILPSIRVFSNESALLDHSCFRFSQNCMFFYSGSHPLETTPGKSFWKEPSPWSLIPQNLILCITLGSKTIYVFVISLATM